jgi:hypothetical protein
MKKFLILFVFVFSVPIFSQDVETEIDSAVLLNYYKEIDAFVAAIKEAQKKENEVFSVFNEEKYLKGKRRLKKGIILTSVGLGVSFLPFLGFLEGGHDAYVGVMIAGILCWPAGSGLTMAGIPITITGAKQTAKYKPSVAFAPNGIKFTMEF